MEIIPLYGHRTIHMPMLDGLNEQAFFELCIANKHVNFERESDGSVVISAAKCAERGMLEASFVGSLGAWLRLGNAGIAFGPSTGFALPNGAVCSPDCSWFAQHRWDALAKRERQQFAHIAPDFVCEIRLDTDRLKTLQDKMEEYIQNGVRLGFLIDPAACKGWSYKPDHEPLEVAFPEKLSGEEVMPGFGLDFGIFS